MNRTMREIMERAVAEMRESPAREVDEGEAGYWDPDAWEEEVIRFTRQSGRRMVQTWAEVKAEQAKAQAPFVPAAGKPPPGPPPGQALHRWQPPWWLSAFGRIEAQAPCLRCPQGHSSYRPFQELTGLKFRGKSLALQRALTGFGAGKSFEQACRQL